MNDDAFEARVAGVRAFNRFYTRHVGALNEGLLKSRFSLTEARVLYELNFSSDLTAADLARDLRLDQAYLSRLLKRFAQQGLLRTQACSADRRRRLLALTEKGREAFSILNSASRQEVGALLKGLSAQEQTRLLSAMREVRAILEPDRQAPPTVIRPHRPGDIGWIVHRQARLYWEEYRWDARFEGLVAGIAGAFLSEHDPKREHCWVAERDGEILGSVFLVRVDDDLAKLRMLYVEPAARGEGLGRRLVEECISFAQAVGYRRMTLWTNDVLHAARRIYETTGFALVSEEPHHSFGHDLVGQIWERPL